MLRFQLFTIIILGLVINAKISYSDTSDDYGTWSLVEQSGQKTLKTFETVLFSEQSVELKSLLSNKYVHKLEENPSFQHGKVDFDSMFFSENRGKAGDLTQAPPLV